MSSAVPCTQVLVPLHTALQSVALNDPLLRVSVGLRLALHLEAAADPAAAATVLQQVGRTISLYWHSAGPVVTCPIPVVTSPCWRLDSVVKMHKRCVAFVFAPSSAD